MQISNKLVSPQVQRKKTTFPNFFLLLLSDKGDGEIFGMEVWATAAAVLASDYNQMGKVPSCAADHFPDGPHSFLHSIRFAGSPRKALSLSTLSKFVADG